MKSKIVPRFMVDAEIAINKHEKGKIRIYKAMS